MFIIFFWYFQPIFIFRGPIYELFHLFRNKWQPWKYNLTSDYHSGSLKTHESEFCFSGLPKFDNQGCHISGGYEDTISRLMSDDGQNTNLNYPAFRFFRGIRLESCILRPPVSTRQTPCRPMTSQTAKIYRHQVLTGQFARFSHHGAHRGLSAHISHQGALQAQ